MFESIDPHWSRDLVLQPVPSQVAIVPRLALERTGTLRQFFSNLTAILGGPAPPKQFLGEPFFRNCWIERRFPKYSFAAAIVLQALLIRFPPPIWTLPPADTAFTSPQMELTWYGPMKDSPVLLPAVRTPKAALHKDAPKAPPQRAADAFHPRLTILSEPLHPTHPQQTLVQPKAPQEPPKILPALPNIVQLAGSEPARPKLQLMADRLTALRPKAPASIAASNVAAPEVTSSEKQLGAINIASSSRAQPKPLLPVNSMSAPRATRRRADANAAAPDIRGRAGEGETLIALSATPAAVAPPPAVPAGNLSARVSISPDGPRRGGPGTSAAGGDEGHDPEGIIISGGSGASASPTSSLGIGSAARGAGDPLASRPVPRPRVAPEGSKSLSSEAAMAAEGTPKLGLTPQEALGAKHLYTMHVNMPNLTSASGSWVLNFAELEDSISGVSIKPEESDLAGPIPLRKVDPKYPPELRTAHVDGEVVLYAIIRKDGSVDSIQLMKSVDPRLDANAMEALAQWKFRPAEKHGQPVDLEAVVYIPFRSRGPAF